MKKQSLLFKILFLICFSITCCAIYFILFMSCPFSYKSSPKEEVTIYDTSADGTSVSNDKLYPQKINRVLEGHFIDPDTNGCFFLCMKMLNHEVDIDKYYLDFFNETDQAIFHEGQIGPLELYQISIIYLYSQKLNLSVKDLSDQNKSYILKAGANNYPIIIGYGHSNGEEATPYVIYSVKDNMVYMTNIHETIGLDKQIFLENGKNNYAIIYGKYG